MTGTATSHSTCCPWYIAKVWGKVSNLLKIVVDYGVVQTVCFFLGSCGMFDFWRLGFLGLGPRWFVFGPWRQNLLLKQRWLVWCDFWPRPKRKGLIGVATHHVQWYIVQTLIDSGRKFQVVYDSHPKGYKPATWNSTISYSLPYSIPQQETTS